MAERTYGWLAKAGGNPRAVRPSGECGSTSKCRGCLSDFLCFMKAKEEQELIIRKRDGYCPLREDEQHCEHWWDGGKCCGCDYEGAPSEVQE